MKMRRSAAAFSLVELLVAGAVSTVVGLVIYGVASEGLIAFARNVSINRSYSDARRSLDRIAASMQSAGHVPILINATGGDVLIVPGVTPPPQPGIRFWRYGVKPRYVIPQGSSTTLDSPSLNGKTMTISLASPSDTFGSTASSGTGSTPVIGDLITVPILGFQGAVTGVTATGTSATLTFANNISTYTSPVLTSLPTVTPPISCVDWTPVAFLVVGKQLLYFPRFISGTTSITNPANYKVVTNMITPTTGLPNTLLPFSLGPTPSINVDLYAEAPDYNNRKLGTANTYTYFQTALSSRNPIIMRSPY